MEETDIRLRIQHAANELIMQYSIRSVSMDDIAASLGISKKTIYQYFKDKEELVDAVVSNIFNYNRSCCEGVMQKAENAVHEMFLALGMQAEIFKTMNPAILYDLQKYHPKVFAKFTDFRNGFLLQIVQNNLRKGLEEGLFRKEIKVDVLSKLRVENIFLPFNPEFRNGLNESFFELHEEIILHFLFGLVNEKGYLLAHKYLLEHRKINPANK